MKLNYLAKKVFVFLLCLICVFTIFGCSNQKDYSKYYSNDENPLEDSTKDNGDLDFIVLHNYVIDNLHKEMNPFFFIKKGEFDIDGDNKKREIIFKFNCDDKTTEQDAALFVVWVTKLIANGAAEQSAMYKKSDEETYGTVFDYWTLIIDGKVEGNSLIYKKIKPKEKMPYDARYVHDLTTNDGEE